MPPTQFMPQETVALFRDLPIETPTSFISLDEPSGCTTVSARYGDGTMWESPVAGPTEPASDTGTVELSLVTTLSSVWLLSSPATVL